MGLPTSHHVLSPSLHLPRKHGFLAICPRPQCPEKANTLNHLPEGLQRLTPAPALSRLGSHPDCRWLGHSIHFPLLPLSGQCPGYTCPGESSLVQILLLLALKANQVRLDCTPPFGGIRGPRGKSQVLTASKPHNGPATGRHSWNVPQKLW